MNVLLATDGRQHSEKAVSYAFNYAGLQKAHLYVVFVVSPKAEEDKDKLIQFGRNELEKLKAEAGKKGFQITTLLEAGNPYETIIRTSERMNADAIIVGTSGKTAIDRVLIGSVSEYVVRNAKCTVIVVK